MDISRRKSPTQLAATSEQETRNLLVVDKFAILHGKCRRFSRSQLSVFQQYIIIKLGSRGNISSDSSSLMIYAKVSRGEKLRLTHSTSPSLLALMDHDNPGFVRFVHSVNRGPDIGVSQ